jgi:hypothetical protein
MKIFRAIFVGLALSALLWVPSSSLAQYDKKPCGCTSQDNLDLDSRIQQTEAAKRELDRMIKEWSTPTRATVTMGEAGRQNNMSAEEFRDQILMKQQLNPAMFHAYIPNARAFGAERDYKCNVTFPKEPTKCLKGALLEHEGMHEKLCREKEQLLLFAIFANWQSNQLVVDYLKEEREGYRLENERLKEEREKLKQCFLTDLDPSTKAALNQAFAQRDRNNDSANRLSGYGASLEK